MEGRKDTQLPPLAFTCPQHTQKTHLIRLCPLYSSQKSPELHLGPTRLGTGDWTNCSRAGNRGAAPANGGVTQKARPDLLWFPVAQGLREPFTPTALSPTRLSSCLLAAHPYRNILPFLSTFLPWPQWPHAVWLVGLLFCKEVLVLFPIAPTLKTTEMMLPTSCRVKPRCQPKPPFLSGRSRSGPLVDPRRRQLNIIFLLECVVGVGQVLAAIRVSASLKRPPQCFSLSPPSSPGTVPEPPLRIPGPHPTSAAGVAQSPSSFSADRGEVLAGLEMAHWYVGGGWGDHLSNTSTRVLASANVMGRGLLTGLAGNGQPKALMLGVPGGGRLPP